MAVAPRFHPGCDEARALRSHHEKEYALAKDLPGSRLATMLGARRERAYAEHDEECPKCWAYARACLDCGVDLTSQPHRFRCPHNIHKWRGLFSTRAPPLASDARKRPAPLETPPPRRVTLEPAPPRPPPKATAPPPPRPKPKPAAPPKPAPHAVLGVKPDATVSEIRAAYREKAMEYHPDRVASLAPEFKKMAEQRMRDINNAYEELLRLAAAQR